MKKNVVIAIVVIFVLLLAGFYLMKVNANKISNNTPNPVATQNSSPKSINDLLMSKIDQKCSFSSNTALTSTTSLAYISSGKIRGDFSIVTSGKTTMSHAIVDGKTVYFWPDGKNSGYKITNLDTQASTSPVASLDFNQKSDYKCEPWLVDQSLFTLPKDVAFKDISALMPSATQAASSSGSSDTSKCSYCDSLSGDNKTQCLSALNCK